VLLFFQLRPSRGAGFAQLIPEVSVPFIEFFNLVDQGQDPLNVELLFEKIFVFILYVGGQLLGL